MPHLQIGDQQHKPGGWRVADPAPRFSCVFPPGREPDPAMVAAIKAVCPDAHMMWMSDRYIPPDGGPPVVCGWYCIGRHVWNPRSDREAFGVNIPADWEGPVPNLLETALCGRTGADGSPAPFEPLTWGFVHRVERAYSESMHGTGSGHIASVIDHILDENRAKEAHAKKHYEEEQAYKLAEFNKYAAKKLAEIPDDEMRDILAWQQSQPMDQED